MGYINNFRNLALLINHPPFEMGSEDGTADNCYTEIY